jgi:DNA-binding response OmpR family regulator
MDIGFPRNQKADTSDNPFYEINIMISNVRNLAHPAMLANSAASLHGDLQVDSDDQVIRGGQRIPLGGDLLALLKRFMKSPGEVLSREKLGLTASGAREAVFRLRGAIGHDLIETVRGEGYRFHAPCAAPRVRTVATAAGTYQIEEAGHTVTCNGTPVELTSTEYKYLLNFVMHLDKVLSRADLSLTESGKSPHNRVVDALVRNLCQKVDPDGKAFQTVRRQGWRLIGVDQGPNAPYEPSQTVAVASMPPSLKAARPKPLLVDPSLGLQHLSLKEGIAVPVRFLRLLTERGLEDQILHDVRGLVKDKGPPQNSVEKVRLDSVGMAPTKRQDSASRYSIAVTVEGQYPNLHRNPCSFTGSVLLELDREGKMLRSAFTLREGRAIPQTTPLWHRLFD